MTDRAELWRKPKVPNNLFINHGMYLGDGIGPIIDELERKPTSNRALYSLISQEHIIKSEDKPIPSFMIFQCAIDHEILYCTVYFRALEVANFFRINLEEIRLNICDILNKVSASKIRLTVLAFSAYNKPNQITLEKSEIDLKSSLRISDLYEENPSQTPELLEKKAKETTVIDVSGLEAIKDWHAPERKKSGQKGLMFLQ